MQSALRNAISVVATARPRPRRYVNGTTIVTVNWNSLPFLRPMVAATQANSPPDARIVVVDNDSTDGSREWLATRPDIRTIRLPVNVGHGLALDLASPTIDTEYLAVLDVDAFPISGGWLDESTAALQSGASVAGIRLHRNYIHPSFLVIRTELVHRLRLTFRPWGRMSGDSDRAPMFFDVGEMLSQRLIIRGGGSSTMHRFEITESIGPNLAGSVYGGLVYHNFYATQGDGNDAALEMWHDALRRHLPAEVWSPLLDET
jgi:glycosyltransferase involved in cell wall biosynthesis